MGPDRGHEQRGAHDSGDRQDRLGGQDRVLVGVGQAGDETRVLCRQRVAVQPPAARPDENERGQQQREVNARRGGGPFTLGLQLQAAIDVVGHGRGQRAQDQGHGEEPDDEAKPRQGEDEEPDVEVELCVLGAERHPVDPEQEGLPLACGGRSGKDAEHRGSGDRGQTAQRLEQLAVVVEVLLLCRNRRIDRTRAIPDQHAGSDDRGREQTAHDKEPDLGEQLDPEDRGEADAVVPEHLGPQLRGDGDDHDDDGQDGQGGSQRTATAQREVRHRGAGAGGGSATGPATGTTRLRAAGTAEPVSLTQNIARSRRCRALNARPSRYPNLPSRRAVPVSTL